MCVCVCVCARKHMLEFVCVRTYVSKCVRRHMPVCAGACVGVEREVCHALASTLIKKLKT